MEVGLFFAFVFLGDMSRLMQCLHHAYVITRMIMSFIGYEKSVFNSDKSFQFTHLKIKQGNKNAGILSCSRR